MPIDINTPDTTPAIDRLGLAVSEARGAEPSVTGACGSGCALCICFADEG